MAGTAVATVGVVDWFFASAARSKTTVFPSSAGAAVSAGGVAMVGSAVDPGGGGIAWMIVGYEDATEPGDSGGLGIAGNTGAAGAIIVGAVDAPNAVAVVGAITSGAEEEIGGEAAGAPKEVPLGGGIGGGDPDQNGIALSGGGMVLRTTGCAPSPAGADPGGMGGGAVDDATLGGEAASSPPIFAAEATALGARTRCGPDPDAGADGPGVPGGPAVFCVGAIAGGLEIRAAGIGGGRVVGGAGATRGWVGDPVLVMRSESGAWLGRRRVDAASARGWAGRFLGWVDLRRRGSGSTRLATKPAIAAKATPPHSAMVPRPIGTSKRCGA